MREWCIISKRLLTFTHVIGALCKETLLAGKVFFPLGPLFMILKGYKVIFSVNLLMLGIDWQTEMNIMPISTTYFHFHLPIHWEVYIMRVTEEYFTVHILNCTKLYQICSPKKLFFTSKKYFPSFFCLFFLPYLRTDVRGDFNIHGTKYF